MVGKQNTRGKEGLQQSVDVQDLGTRFVLYLRASVEPLEGRRPG